MKKYLFLLLGIALGITVIGGALMAAPQGTLTPTIPGQGVQEQASPNVLKLQDGILAQKTLLLVKNQRTGRALAILDDVRENGKDYSFSRLAQLQAEWVRLGQTPVSFGSAADALQEYEERQGEIPQCYEEVRNNELVAWCDETYTPTGIAAVYRQLTEELVAANTEAQLSIRKYELAIRLAESLDTAPENYTANAIVKKAQELGLALAKATEDKKRAQ